MDIFYSVFLLISCFLFLYLNYKDKKSKKLWQISHIIVLEFILSLANVCVCFVIHDTALFVLWIATAFVIFLDIALRRSYRFDYNSFDFVDKFSEIDIDSVLENLEESNKIKVGWIGIFFKAISDMLFSVDTYGEMEFVSCFVELSKVLKLVEGDDGGDSYYIADFPSDSEASEEV